MIGELIRELLTIIIMSSMAVISAFWALWAVVKLLKERGK